LQTTYKKYGEDYYKNRSHELQKKVDQQAALERRMQTCLEKYGVNHVMHVEEIKEKNQEWKKDPDKMQIAIEKTLETKRNNGSIASEEDAKTLKSYKGKAYGLSHKYYKENYPELYVKLGRCGVDGALQIDHIVPLTECYRLGLSPEEASHPSNLQILHWKENLRKSNRVEQ
jgi:5-methylcytosine-specific restriction endonuclease McrA